MRSYWPLRIILLLFLAPFLASIYLLLHGDYKKFNTVQHGDLIQPVQNISFKSLYDLSGAQISPIPIPNKWHVIYLSPETCGESCQAQKQILAKVHTALGADRERLTMATTINSNLLDQRLKDGSMLVINPLGFYIMRYDPETKPKDLVKDLKRLLKYSHAR